MLFERIRGGEIDDNLFADLIPDLVVIWTRSIFLNLTLDPKAIQDASLQSSMYHQHQLNGDTPTIGAHVSSLIYSHIAFKAARRFEKKLPAYESSKKKGRCR